MEGESNAEAQARLAFRIVSVKPMTKGIGFAPYAFHEGLVFHGVLARGLKFSPQALDDGQTMAAVIYSRTVSQARECAPI